MKLNEIYEIKFKSKRHRFLFKLLLWREKYIYYTHVCARFYYDKIGNDYVLRVYFLRVLKYLNTKSSFLVCWHGHDVLTWLVACYRMLLLLL